MGNFGNLLLAVLAASLILFVIGCGKTARQTENELAYRQALESLSKIDAATQVGVNYQQYGSLLIEAKAKINEIDSAYLIESQKTTVSEVMQGYVDAASFWAAKIQSKDVTVTEKYENGVVKNFTLDGARQMSDVVDKYKLQVSSKPGYGYLRENANVNATGKTIKMESVVVEPDQAMKICWSWSAARLRTLKKQ